MQTALGLRFRVYLLGIIATIVSLWTVNCRAVERIWLNGATVNGKSVKVFFDSGAAGIFLTKDAVKRLGLKVVDPGTNGDGDTAVYTFKWDGAFKTDFEIINENLGCDGMMGWNCVNDGVIRIDADKGDISALWHAPWFGKGWARFPIMTNSGILDIEVSHDDGTKGIISIDTGNPLGVALSSRLWRQWEDAHKQASFTVRAFMSWRGFFVRKEALADRIQIGPLVLTNVPVMETWSNDIEDEWGSRYDGILGMAALDHLDVIVDGIHNVAYLRLKKTPPPPYSYNRLGAMFFEVPGHPDEASAQVLPRSPAYDAGIRDGDVLVGVDGLPPMQWTTNWAGNQFEMPAGTQLHFTLQRNGTNFETVATLRNILQPNDDKQ